MNLLFPNNIFYALLFDNHKNINNTINIIINDKGELILVGGSNELYINIDFENALLSTNIDSLNINNDYLMLGGDLHG